MNKAGKIKEVLRTRKEYTSN